MLLRLQIVTVIIAALTGAAIAGSINEKQRNVVQHVANATILADKCKTLTFNRDLASKMLVYIGIDPDDIVHLAEMVAAAQHARDDLSGKSGEQICRMGPVLYGKNGTMVPGLIE